MLPYLTICYHISLYVTIFHYMLPSFTIFNNLSRSITIFHLPEVIVKNFNKSVTLRHSDTQTLRQTDRRTQWLTGPDLERHAPLKKMESVSKLFKFQSGTLSQKSKLGLAGPWDVMWIFLTDVLGLNWVGLKHCYLPANSPRETK